MLALEVEHGHKLSNINIFLVRLFYIVHYFVYYTICAYTLMLKIQINMPSISLEGFKMRQAAEIAGGVGGRTLT